MTITHTTKSSNEQTALNVLQKCIQMGIQEFCLCPGSRNSPFVLALSQEKRIKQFFWFEERSAAFFALGRSRLTNRPVAVITTSGTAAGELLPAAMEAYYTGVPLLLITADRPRHFRNKGAPQSAEQVGLFGVYARFEQDISDNETCQLENWRQDGPAHLNVCFDEPKDATPAYEDLLSNIDPMIPQQEVAFDPSPLDHFLHQTQHPFVIVSSIKKEARSDVASFLSSLNAPIYLEAVSGLREDPKLQHLRIFQTDQLLKRARNSNYLIDGVLRIGGVPTIRLWRDLEETEKSIPVFSINDVPFSGLSRGSIHCTPLPPFFNKYQLPKNYQENTSKDWIQADRTYSQRLHALLEEEPDSEPALVYQFSKRIPLNSHVYLGNSLPIREWDSFAGSLNRNIIVHASRGLNGIDGQISTFLGLCTENTSNWALLGDLTTLYDLAGPWILRQLQEMQINLVVINNGGGKIFERMYSLPSIQNLHHTSFKPFADLWNMSYEKWSSIPDAIQNSHHRLIEIVPDNEATTRFWSKLKKIC